MTSHRRSSVVWWCLVLYCLLIIGCVETNPGPRKGKKSISYRKATQNRKQYMKEYRSELSVQSVEKETISNTKDTSSKENTNFIADVEHRAPLAPLTDAERKARSRLKLEVKETEKNSDVARKRRLRSSVDEKEKENLFDIVRKSRRRSESPEYRNAENERQKIGKRERRSLPEYKDMENEKQKMGKRDTRLDQEYKAIENEKQKVGKRECRSHPEYKDMENEKQKAAKHECRSHPEYRDMENKKQKVGKRERHSHPEYRDMENEKQKVGKREHRSHPEYKDMENEKQKAGKRECRSHPEYRDMENEKQKVGKREHRSLPEYRDMENDKQKTGKRELRSKPDFKKEENAKDTRTKQKLRSQSLYRQRENENQMIGKQKLRSDDFKKLENDCVNLKSKQKQRKDPIYQEIERMKNCGSKRRKRASCNKGGTPAKKKRLDNIESVAKVFRKAIQDGPVYICSSCKRTLYRHSVKCVPNHRYKNRKKGSMEYVLTGHVSLDRKEYICMTCHRALMSSRVPTQSEYNCLQLDEIPNELSCLCQLEERLVAQRLPFMQICSLPKGGQKGIHGPVVNVPSRLDSLMTTLPRLPIDTGLVPVKLKRKLKYKGHSVYQCIKPSNVKKALQYLLHNNALYADVKRQEHWVKECFKMDKELSDQLFAPFVESRPPDEDYSKHTNTDQSDSHYNNGNEEKHQKLLNKTASGQCTEVSAFAEEDKEEESCPELPSLASSDESSSDSDSDQDENEEKERLKGLPFNSCLQPSDILPKKDINADDIVSLAPGENQQPLSMLTDASSEVLAFPVLFPSGRFGMNYPDRPVKISAKKYFNQRVLNTDPRFARNVDYLFYSQYFTEMKQVIDSVNIAMRKGNCGNAGRLNAGMMTSDRISDLLKQNDGYRFIQSIRGSYPYWERTLSDLNAMVRQLGIPTWFVTLSAADLRWPETIQLIARQYGQELSEEDVTRMNWQDRCNWIRRNPVTCARHFDFKYQKFLKEVIMSEAHPIGQVRDFFYRVEFQQRGSPHIHALFWIEGAPLIGSSKETDVCTFIDRYISAQLPSKDTELQELVTSVQTHSHSGTCRKTGKSCRFHFPRPPSSKTIVSHPLTTDDVDPSLLKGAKEAIADVLKKVFDILQDNTEKTLKEILKLASLTDEEYTQALDRSSSSISIILRRNPRDTSINNFNPVLLKLWRANMDIQYVTDPWACAMYILSNISKGERQMGKLLKEASKECASDDSIRQQMRKVGNVFLSHREVSAQEAVYRLLSIPLKKSSRQTIFVNTGMPDSRVHILKPRLKLEELPPDSEDIFQPNILDRYSARPESMEDMCLADFATGYRMDYEKNSEEVSADDMELDISEGKGQKIKPLNNMGTIKKRKVRAIIRTPRFSKVKAPEKYYHSILMLYLPWHKEQSDLLDGHDSYEQHFEKRRDTVSGHMASFETNSEQLDDALENFNSQDYPESAWDKLASETQHELQDELLEGRKPSEEHRLIDPVELGTGSALPELHSQSVGYTVEGQLNRLSNKTRTTLVW